jgi:UDP-2,3-diacylglucosamine pyrophosphatase LpxH
MLVFISDLHFADGTAGEHNIPPQAFDYFFEDLVAIAGKPSNNIKEVKIVLLGDIFDLLRSEHWLAEEIPENDKPWGYNDAKIEEHANSIFEAIITANSLSLQEIKAGLDSLKAIFPETKLYYRPGNHDRLCNKYRSLRDKVCETLAIPLEIHNPSNLFPNVHPPDLHYGVFARHGHEFDKFNYEGGTSYTPWDYERVPIGDPITTEIVASLPYTLEKNLRKAAHTIWPDLSADSIDEEIRRIKKNFQEIDNVRPLAAIPSWLLYQVEANRAVKTVIKETVDEVTHAFEALNFVKNWYSVHDKWEDWRDEADQVQALLFFLRNFKPYSTEKLWEWATKAKDYFMKDYLLEAAPDEYFHLDSRIRYIVYGHTHEPQVIGIRTVPAYPSHLEHVYLNTGTWRTLNNQAVRDKSFITWKNMTYVIFYLEEERKERKADFETWTGTLKYV